jgi:cleavage and polyadenylation specificity factor subunit 1
VEWTSGIDVGTPLPSRRVQKERMYSDVVYEPSTGLLIASATLKAPFASYDEDANIMWEPEGRYTRLHRVTRTEDHAGPNIAWPTADSSTLELITSDTFITMDGLVFFGLRFVAVD